MQYPRFKEWIDKIKDPETQVNYGNASAVLFEQSGLTPDEFLDMDPDEAREKAWAVVSKLVSILERAQAASVKGASKKFYNDMNNVETFKWNFREHMIR